jgi:hypothetical protein
MTLWPSYIREFCGWVLVISFVLLLIWPGWRD